MINILIIDNESDKIQDIIRVITSKTSLNTDSIDYSLDIVDARRKTLHKTYDLVLLDMNLPISINDKSQEYGGLEFIDLIDNNQIKNVPKTIIGLTGHSNLCEHSRKELEKKLWSLLYYQKNDQYWENCVISHIKHLENTQNSLYGECFKKFDIAVLTAVSIEFEALLKLPFEWEKFYVPNDKVTTYYAGEFSVNERKIKIVSSCLPKMGMVSSAIIASKMCFHFHPKYFFMPGIAAGIKGKNNFGDILVTEMSWDWGSGKIADDFSPDHTQITTDAYILEKIKEIQHEQTLIDNIKNKYPGQTPSSSLNLHIGPIASGASVLEDFNTINNIKKYQRKLIGIEMEIYGIMSAVKYSIEPKPIAVCIKSVCDFGDNEKNDNWQHYASYTSIQVMNLLMARLDY